MRTVARAAQLRHSARLPEAGAPPVSQLRTDVLLRLFSSDRAALVRYVRRRLPSREDPEDIVQEALMRTCERVQEVMEPRAFAFTVVRNLAANSRRHTRLAKTDASGDLSQSPVVSAGTSVEGEILAEEECRLLREAVERLSPQCRAVFTLRIFQSCSYREIALRLGIAPKTVENHIGRALRETNEYLRDRYQLTASKHRQHSSTAER